MTELQVTGPDGHQFISDGDFGGGKHMASYVQAASYGAVSIVTP